MIYITGDCHCNFSKLNTKNFSIQKSFHKKDENYVIICGDFGAVWDNSKEDKYWLKWLEEKPFTTLFVDGNHENFNLLNSYSVEEWNGGKIHRIKDNIIHLMRGQVYEIDNKKIFTFGGAESHDLLGGILDPEDSSFKKKKKDLNKKHLSYRIKGISWWKEEMPSEKEYLEGIQNLEKHNWKVDYVITHCCSTSIQNEFLKGLYNENKLTDYLEYILNKLDFNTHYFGHYHDTRLIKDKYQMLYEEIKEL